MGVLRRHPIVSSLILLSAAVLGVVGMTAVAVWRAAHADDASLIGEVDVIVVLGAAEYDGRPSPVFAGHLEQAALLYR